MLLSARLTENVMLRRISNKGKWLFIALHLTIAGVFVAASVMACRLFLIPFWVSGPLGLILYGMMLAITRLEDRSEGEDYIEPDER